MNAGKITQLHVYLVGGFLLICIGVGMFFLTLKPLNDANATLARNITTLEQTPVQVDTKSFTIANAADAQKALAGARTRRTESEAKLNRLSDAKQLPEKDKIVIEKELDKQLSNGLPRWIGMPQKVLTLMSGFARRSAKKYGVEVFTSFSAPAIGGTNPKAIPTDVITMPLGGVMVTGDFNKVLAWIENWNNAPLLSSVDGLRCSLAGTNGKIRATAAVVAYIFPTGPGATIPSAAGAGSGGYGGGMGGGMMDPSMAGMGPAGMDPSMGGAGAGMAPGGMTAPGGIAPGLPGGAPM